MVNPNPFDPKNSQPHVPNTPPPVYPNQTPQPPYPQFPPQPQMMPYYPQPGTPLEDETGGSGKGKSGGGGIDLKGLIVSAIIALLIVFIMNTFITPVQGKHEYQTMVNTLEGQIGDLQKANTTYDTRIKTLETNSTKQAADFASLSKSDTDQMTKLSTDLQTTITSKLAGYATTSDVNTSINNISTTLATTNAKVATIDNQIATSVNTNVATLKTQIATDEATITTLTARIAALEAKQTTSASGTNSAGITAKLKSAGNSVLTATDNQTLSSSFRITLQNTTAADITDIMLDISIQTDMIQGTHTAILSGGGTSWQSQGYSYSFYDFVNSTWGLTVPANTTSTLYLTLTISESLGQNAVNYLNTYGSNPVGYNISVAVD